MSYIVIDIENDSSGRYKRKAGNFLYDSIIAIGLKYPEELKSIYLEDEGFSLKFFRDALWDKDCIVGHNLTHDLLFLWQDFDIQQFFNGGGKIWDTQLAHYILFGQQEKYPALRDIAVKYYGCKERNKVMESYWDTGLQTSEIPEELVRYDVEQDVLDTEQIYLKQRELAENRGMLKLIESQMNSLLATIEMEYNGFKIDKSILYQTRIVLDIKLKDLNVQLDNIVEKYWSLPVEFNVNSTHHLSYILFGGYVTYQWIKCLGAPRVVELLAPRFKGTKEEKTILITLGGGIFQTNEEVLKNLVATQSGDIVKFCQILLEIRNTKKKLSTYYASTLELIYDTDDCVHPTFNHCATDPGRLSCSNPNIQNQPNDKMVKEHFISRYKNGKIVNFDFKQIEVYIFAYLCQDSNLLNLLNNQIDVYKYIGTFVYTKAIQDITAEERTTMKPCVLGIIYGNGAKTLSENCGQSIEWCKDFIETFYELFPKAKLWHEKIAQEVEERGYLRNFTGRVLKFKKFPAKFEWQFRKGIKESYNPPDIKNWPVQSLATADIVLHMLGKVWRESIKYRYKFVLINTVHDSIMLDCQEEYVRFAINLVKNILDDSRKEIYNYWGVDIGVELKVDVSVGDSWASLAEV